MLRDLSRAFTSNLCRGATHPSETVPSVSCCLCREVPLSFPKGLSSRARLCQPPPALPTIFHSFELPAGLQSLQSPHSPLQHCPVKYTPDPSITPKAVFPPQDGHEQPQEQLGHQQELFDATGTSARTIWSRSSPPSEAIMRKTCHFLLFC